jgi:hypothetical protein
MRATLRRKSGQTALARWLERGECRHPVLVGIGDLAGRCLECGTSVPTPFTIHSFTAHSE